MSTCFQAYSLVVVVAVAVAPAVVGVCGGGGWGDVLYKCFAGIYMCSLERRESKGVHKQL